MASGLRPIEKAPIEGRRLLGVLLQQRRTELGWTHRPAFTRERLPLTPSGNPNTRLAADIEEAYRDNFPESRLRQLARAYLVAYESLVDVAHLRARALAPAPPAASAAAPPARPRGLPAAPAGQVREELVYPYAFPVWRRIVQGAAQGIMDPSGADLFPAGSADAKAWDGTAGTGMSLSDRAWLVADLQCRRARNADSRADAG